MRGTLLELSDASSRFPPQPLAHAGPAADDALVHGIRNHDEAALLALYDRYQRLLLSLALRIVGDRETAEEVLQDVFVRAWDGSASFDARRGSVSAWLFGITRNRAIDVLRSHHHRGRMRERDALPGDFRHEDGSDLAEWAALRLSVRQALDALPPERRIPLELVYFGGMTQREAALALGQPLGTTKGRIRAAMDQLRGALAPGENQP